MQYISLFLNTPKQSTKMFLIVLVMTVFKELTLSYALQVVDCFCIGRGQNKHHYFDEAGIYRSEKNR